MSNKTLDYDRLPYCCGVMELGNFGGHDWPEVVADTWLEVLIKTRKLLAGFPLQLNFVRYPGKEEFEHQDFLDLIYRQEDHLHLHEFVNPNSNNTVCMVMLKNEKGATTNE